jgi:ankyrin repeat protein
MDPILLNRDHLCLNLLEASRMFHLECIRIFLNNGENINTTDYHGLTPLHYASIRNHECVKLLLDNNADVNKKTSTGGRSALHFASKYGSNEIIRTLLDRGAHIDIKNDQKQTPLHWASYAGHQNCVVMLLDRGAEVNKKDNKGHTALHLVSYKGCRDCIAILLDRGADLDAKDNIGQTPLDVANHQIKKFINEYLSISIKEPDCN